jgi:5-methylcytosine-specific restriction endonuclease McrA
MRHHTPKRAAIEKELKRVHREIWEERPHNCFNCGISNALTFAHLVPRSRRKDLIAEKDNLILLCMDCHHTLDHGDRQSLRTYPEILERIKALDEEYYYLLKMKL